MKVQSNYCTSSTAQTHEVLIMHFMSFIHVLMSCNNVDMYINIILTPCNSVLQLPFMEMDDFDGISK